MITKHDWNAALDSWIDEERERLDGPPSAEEVVAYLGGRLAPAEAARVRALLVYYPELTPLLNERVEKPRAFRKPFALRLYAAAATVLVAILGVHAIVEQRRSTEPAVVVSQHEFKSALTRGAHGDAAYELKAGEQRYLITAVPAQPPAARAYSLEITRNSQRIWSAENVRPLDDTFVVDIPGRFLMPGTYALNVRADGHVIEGYAFRVVER